MTALARPLSAAQTSAARELLRTAPFAHVAMVESEGPYVIPLNFVFVEDGSLGRAAISGTPAALGPEEGLGGHIYFHTGDGRKADALAVDGRVCLAITDCVAFHQGDSPCSDGFTFRSLLVWGDARLLQDEGRREAALRAIVEKYDRGAAGAQFDEAVLARTLLYEVAIEAAGYKERLPRP